MAGSGIRLGIIGTGMIANAHVRQAREVAGLDIVAAADVRKAVLDEFCNQHGIPARYTSYEKMLAKEDLDAVTVALPVFLHAPASIAALQAGAHVLCEKPMARNGQEAAAMVAAAKKANRVLGVYYRRRFQPISMAVKRLIEQGKLGHIYFVRSTGSRWRGRPNFDMPRFGAWFMKKKLAGGGVVMDLMGYDLDLIFWLLDWPRVKAVSASCWQEIDREKARAAGVDIEELSAAMLRLSGNVSVFLERGFAANVEDPDDVALFGSEAGVKLHPPQLFCNVRGKMAAREIKPRGKPPAGGPIGDFVKEIRGQGPTRMCTGAQGEMITRVQDAVYESARAGREIEVSIRLR